jgi:hypothetical protein
LPPIEIGLPFKVTAFAIWWSLFVIDVFTRLF